VVVFPKLYAQTRLMWVEQKPVLLTGKIDSRDDKANMLCDAIETIESVKGTQGNLKISIPEGTNTNTLKELKEILMAHQGEQKVTLSFEGKTRREVEVPFGVTWNQDLSRKIAVALEKGRVAS
jgi:DNA polymerase III alpha subunit